MISHEEKVVSLEAKIVELLGDQATVESEEDLRLQQKVAASAAVAMANLAIAHAILELSDNVRNAADTISRSLLVGRSA